MMYRGLMVRLPAIIELQGHCLAVVTSFCSHRGWALIVHSVIFDSHLAALVTVRRTT